MYYIYDVDMTLVESDCPMTAEMAEALRDLILSDSRRTEMRTRGLEHAARFTWEETARKTLAIYEEVGGSV